MKDSELCKGYTKRQSSTVATVFLLIETLKKPEVRFQQQENARTDQPNQIQSKQKTVLFQ